MIEWILANAIELGTIFVSFAVGYLLSSWKHWQPRDKRGRFIRR